MLAETQLRVELQFQQLLPIRRSDRVQWVKQWLCTLLVHTTPPTHHTSLTYSLSLTHTRTPPCLRRDIVALIPPILLETIVPPNYDNCIVTRALCGLGNRGPPREQGNYGAGDDGHHVASRPPAAVRGGVASAAI
jgi:hypothetical protein